MSNQGEYIKHGMIIRSPGQLETEFKFILPAFSKAKHMVEGKHFFTSFSDFKTMYPDPTILRNVDELSVQNHYMDVQDKVIGKRKRRPREFFDAQGTRMWRKTRKTTEELE